MANPGIPPLVTVFGGGGFVGRYVCEALLKAGARIRVAERDPRQAFFLQPLGGIGMVQAVAADITRPATVKLAVEGAAAVVNLVGAFKGDLDAIHVAGPRSIAEAAKAEGAAFVHVSAIGADAASESTYGRTKGLGEEAVRTTYARATIVRPSVIFGAEDDFTNRFAGLAGLPFLPVIRPNTRFQPVHARDVARAIAAAALAPKVHGGKTYELGGPNILSMRQLNQEIADLSGRSPTLVDIPDLVASGMASLGFLPGAPLTRDQWIMLQQDNVVTGANGFDAFGIQPASLGSVAGEWLGRFRTGGRFAPRATA